MNLQSNALKFTSKGSVKFEVEITNGLFDDKEVYIEESELFLQVKCQDTGIGIKEDQMNKLFKSFGYIDDGKKLNTKGIGLGLNISK